MKKFMLLFIVMIISISSVSIFAQTSSVNKDNGISVVENPNRVSFLLSDILMRRFSFEYEYVLNNGNMSINIPFSIALTPFEDLWYSEEHWWLGAGIKFYPTGQGTVRYFLGPELRILSVTENNGYYYSSSSTYGNPQDFLNLAFMINNGIIYSPTKDFFVSMSMGLGLLSRDSSSENELLVPYVTTSFRLGFKF